MVEDHKFLHQDLDLTGGNLGVLRSLRTLADPASHLDHTFTMKRCRPVAHQLRQIRGIKNGLRAAFAIPYVDEDQPAKIPPRVNPAH